MELEKLWSDSSLSVLWSRQMRIGVHFQVGKRNLLFSTAFIVTEAHPLLYPVATRSYLPEL